MSKARRTTGSRSRSACSRGSSSIARLSVTGLAGFCGTSLAELVDLPVRHLQHAADVAQHAARLQRAEGDDLRDPVAAVLVLHVADHLVAPVLAEVDVEVRHRHALGIEEALEQQAEADRIEIGDGQRIGDQRAGAGAAARADRNALRLRPLDEVGDDQEVAGIFHPLDDAELEVEPLAVFLGGAAGRQPVRGDAALEARRPPAGAAPRASSTDGMLVADREARQDRRQRPRPEGAALRDLDGGRDRLRQVGEQRRHLGAGLEPVLGGELAAVGVGDQPALGDRRSARRAPRSPRAVAKYGSLVATSGMPLGVGQLDQHRLRHAARLSTPWRCSSI